MLQWLKLMKQGLMIPIDLLIIDLQTILSLIDVQLSEQNN